MIDILKEQVDGSVTQRFQIAFLQKISAQNGQQLDESITENIIELMVKKDMIKWCLKLLQKSKIPES